MLPSFLKAQDLPVNVEFARRALGGLGGLGGYQSPIDFMGMGQDIRRQYGDGASALADARRSVESGAWRDQAFGQHKPGDVILSDEERRKIFQDATSQQDALMQARQAQQNALAGDANMRQSFNDLMRDSGYADMFQGLGSGSVLPLNPLDARSTPFGNFVNPYTAAGQIEVPDNLRPWFEAGMAAQGVTPQQMQMNVHPDGFTRSEERTFTQDPSFWQTTTPYTALGAAGGLGPDADPYQARREAAFNTMNTIGMGRAAMDPSFDWGGLNAAILDYNRANEWGPAGDSFANAQRALASAQRQQQAGFDQAMQARQQASTINQQAYDIMLNKGQQGGVIPNDFARPFYGQVTGIEGFGGQGTPWNPSQPFANAPGFGFGQTQNASGFGWGGGQTGGWGNADQTQQRSDTPASDWGGVFNQRNPWGLS